MSAENPSRGRAENASVREPASTGWWDASKNWLSLPSEIVASILAGTTVLISLKPVNFPPWAIFIGWAGTFASGGPTKEVFKKLWPVMILGSTAAMCIVLLFQVAANHFTGWGFTGMQILILVVINGLMMSTARLTKVFAFVPGMFFGFACYFATMFGGFGWSPGSGTHAALVAWLAVVPMNFIGTIFAWLNVKFSAPAGA
jgi:hypothetical protein